ncbi:hypothetical protein J6U78_05050 [bacterium]|nr:hypothetical protein [bacterium]
MKKLLVLLVLVCAVSALAEEKVLYTLDFEDYEAGSFNNKYGWDRRGWSTRLEAVHDSTAAHSGNVYLDSDGANSWKDDIDISSSYVVGNDLLIKFYVKIPSDSNTKPFHVKLHNIGTLIQDKTWNGYNKEIMEFQIGKSSYYISYGGGSVNRSGLDLTDHWMECGAVIDPSTKTIKSAYVGEFAYDFEDSPVSYSCTETGCNNLIDGVRIMGNGGAGCLGCFDDFSITMLPEPAVFGLIALLGLFFARKQR